MSGQECSSEKDRVYHIEEFFHLKCCKQDLKTIKLSKYTDQAVSITSLSPGGDSNISAQLAY